MSRNPQHDVTVLAEQVAQLEQEQSEIKAMLGLLKDHMATSHHDTHMLTQQLRHFWSGLMGSLARNPKHFGDLGALIERTAMRTQASTHQHLWKQAIAQMMPVGVQSGLAGNLLGQAQNVMASMLHRVLGGARAGGGAVGAHTPYLVGENGAEVFVPTVPGRVVPRHRVGRPPVQVTMHVHAQDAGSFRKAQSQIMAEMTSAMQRSSRRLS